MGHAFDMINRLKQNQELKKDRKFSKVTNHSNLPTNKNFNFKTPTAKELKMLEGKNRAFLKEQKMQNRVILIFAFAVGIAVLYWFSQTGLWAGYIEGFGRYAR